mmetsp:Transcript_16697/g.23666  ORF Transcript_16697/g.23666 Transcript_16697/m.23666 type:complete len:386 (+) Transcript_16697:159-1316(+)
MNSDIPVSNLSAEKINPEKNDTTEKNETNDEENYVKEEQHRVAAESMMKENSNESLTSSQQLALLSLGMFVFFGAHNILQEAIMKIPGFTHGIMLGYFEVVGVTICSFLERNYIARERGRVAPLRSYTALTLCLMMSSSFSNMSLNFINFPTKVVFRSCKLIPAMVIATIINRRVFRSSEYLAAFSITIGLILFAAADWKLTPSFNPIGLVLVSLSVIADAVLPNLQENLFTHGSSRLEVIYYSNIFALVFMTMSTFISGDLFAVFKLASMDPHLQLYLVIYTAISYIAITFYMKIVKKFGGVVAVLLATVRKAMTLSLSFLLFPKDFSWYYVFGAVLVLGGLLAASLIKQMTPKQDNNMGISQQKESQHAEPNELEPLKQNENV